MSDAWIRANSAIEQLADVSRTRGQAQRAAALDALLTLTPENAHSKRVDLAAMIAEALAAEPVTAEPHTLSSDAYALVLADVAAAHAIYGYGDYAGAADALRRLLGN